jgi:hypothetical protein
MTRFQTFSLLGVLATSIFSTLSVHADSPGNLQIMNNLQGYVSGVIVCVDNQATPSAEVANGASQTVSLTPGAHQVKIIDGTYKDATFFSQTNICSLTGYPVIAERSVQIVSGQNSVVSLSGDVTPKDSAISPLSYTVDWATAGSQASEATGILAVAIFQGVEYPASTLCVDNVLVSETASGDGLMYITPGQHTFSIPTDNACPATPLEPFTTTVSEGTITRLNITLTVTGYNPAYGLNNVNVNLVIPANTPTTTTAATTTSTPAPAATKSTTSVLSTTIRTGGSDF